MEVLLFTIQSPQIGVAAHVTASLMADLLQYITKEQYVEWQVRLDARWHLDVPIGPPVSHNLMRSTAKNICGSFSAVSPSAYSKPNNFKVRILQKVSGDAEGVMPANIVNLQVFL